MDWLGMRAFYIAGICLFWCWYVYYRYTKDKSIIQYWGFKTENLGKSLQMLLPFLLTGIFFMGMVAWRKQISLWNPHMLPVMVLYPLWGTVQQFMLTGIVAETLGHTKPLLGRKWSVIVLTSCLFGMIHYPQAVLMVFTFFMEILFLLVFLRWRNIWAIGIAHGLLATFLLYYVMNRDLWIELFAWFQI